jgi:hypothetical protein
MYTHFLIQNFSLSIGYSKSIIVLTQGTQEVQSFFPDFLLQYIANLLGDPHASKHSRGATWY